MAKLTNTDREWKQLRDAAWKRPYTPNGYGYHFANAVVVRINQFKPGAQLRTVVLPTSGGTVHKDTDTQRSLRFFRRLRKWAGFKATTDFPRGRECDGIYGTMFGYTP